MSSPTAVHDSTTSPVPSTMTAVTARAYGGPEVLATETLPVPTPQAGELLVEVRASSLNALDWHFLTGTPYLMRLMSGMRRPKRFVRGADVAGVVVAVGDGVTRFAVGDPVFGEGPGGGCGAVPHREGDERRRDPRRRVVRGRRRHTGRRVDGTAGPADTR